MERRMTATEARVHFGEALREVTDRGNTVVVEHAGKPTAVIISIDHFRRLQANDDAQPEWRALLEAAHAQIRRDGELPLNPSPEEIIRQGREIRDEQILDSLR